ncbi:LOG family protein [Mycolicibacterium baixiangningiae]|uniref:hypothetical protein n=1 Tax=Mycolicibacterium baixiangningiae TaxID=2761578 RepID=UPI0018E5CC9C|nr:hypothetical protein [Mycolicibacterium baixiangningiae]
MTALDLLVRVNLPVRTPSLSGPHGTTPSPNSLAIGINSPSTVRSRSEYIPGLQDLRIVDSTHERKALMAELSDAFTLNAGQIATTSFAAIVTGVGGLLTLESVLGLWGERAHRKFPGVLAGIPNLMAGSVCRLASAGGGSAVGVRGGRVGGRTPVEVDDPRIGVRSNS